MSNFEPFAKHTLIKSYIDRRNFRKGKHLSYVSKRISEKESKNVKFVFFCFWHRCITFVALHDRINIHKYASVAPLNQKFTYFCFSFNTH